MAETRGVGVGTVPPRVVTPFAAHAPALLLNISSSTRPQTTKINAPRADDGEEDGCIRLPAQWPIS